MSNKHLRTFFGKKSKVPGSNLDLVHDCCNVVVHGGEHACNKVFLAVEGAYDKMTAMLGNGRRKYNVKNTGLPSVFIHPSNLGGNCKTTRMSYYSKRSLLFLYFPVGNSVCQLLPFFTTQFIP